MGETTRACWRHDGLGSWHGRYVCCARQGRPAKRTQPSKSSVLKIKEFVSSCEASSMEIVLGCVGKPSAGKSTFFNGVSEGKAKTGNFPFTTIEPNVGISYYRVDCPCVRKVRRARTHGTHGRGETCHREGNPHGICRCGVLFVVAGEVYCTPHESDICTHLPLPCLSFPVFPLSPITAATSPHPGQDGAVCAQVRVVRRGAGSVHPGEAHGRRGAYTRGLRRGRARQQGECGERASLGPPRSCDGGPLRY